MTFTVYRPNSGRWPSRISARSTRSCLGDSAHVQSERQAVAGHARRHCGPACEHAPAGFPSPRPSGHAGGSDQFPAHAPSIPGRIAQHGVEPLVLAARHRFSHLLQIASAALEHARPISACCVLDRTGTALKASKGAKWESKCASSRVRKPPTWLCYQCILVDVIIRKARINNGLYYTVPCPHQTVSEYVKVEFADQNTSILS